MNSIKKIRQSKGLSQSKLATIMKVNQSTIANWESEYRNPSVKQAIKLAKILETTVEQLYK